MDIEKLIDSEMENIPLELRELVEFLSTGEYKIGDISFSHHDENTRFVILEKYPEQVKSSEEELSNGIFTTNIYMNVELIRPVQLIETTFTISNTDDN